VEIMRIAIVDDEEPARLVLREYLEAEPGVEIVAECANGFEAVKAVSELTPDLLFLDVQMPKLDGFEVLELLPADVAVVFVTAHDAFALRAFEVHAVDYLLKPFSEDRLRAAIERARGRKGQSLRGTAGALEEATRLEREARSATAQARFTALVVAALPLGAALLAELASPGYVERLVSSPLTATLAGGAIVLQLAALVLVHRLAKVKG